MANSHTYLLFGGIALAVIGIILLIGAGVYDGVTGNIDGWFWGLLVSGGFLIVIGMVLLIVGWVMAPQASEKKKDDVSVTNVTAAPSAPTQAPPTQQGHPSSYPPGAGSPNGNGVSTTSTHRLKEIKNHPVTGAPMASFESTHHIPSHSVQSHTPMAPGTTHTTPGTNFSTTVEVPLSGSVSAGVGTPSFHQSPQSGNSMYSASSPPMSHPQSGSSMYSVSSPPMSSPQSGSSMYSVSSPPVSNM